MKYLFICFTLAAFCSCTIQRRIYSSTQINNPSLQQKNDHSFSLTYSDPSGFDFTGGYAITNRLAIIGGAYNHRNNDHQTEALLFSDITTDAKLLYRHKGFHGGLGFYFPLSKKETNTYAAFFAGYTKGNFNMDEHNVQTDNSSGTPTTTTNDYFYKTDLGRYFLQGGFTAYMNQLEISLLTRYSYVSYTGVTTNYSTTDQQNFNLPPLGYSKISQFLDFGFDAKYFFSDDRRFGLQLFGSATARLNRKEFNFYYYPSRFGLGFVVKNPFRKK
jgi:hypothetical protein